MPNTLRSLSTYTTMMRVTSAGRPHCKDLHDILAAFIIQMPLSDHRTLFRTYPFSFTTEEAVEILGHLQFTHVHRGPDPLDPTRHVSTRTTTTFSMTSGMAKTLCQQFLQARLIENASDPSNRLIRDKAIWCPTPKGKCMIQDFSIRAQISIDHLTACLDKLKTISVVTLDRQNNRDNTLAFSRPSVSLAFQLMTQYVPCDVLLTDEVNGVDTRIAKNTQYTFYGSQCIDWLCEYTTVVNREEAEMIGSEFILCGWIKCLTDKPPGGNDIIFRSSRNAIYHITDRGCQCLGWKSSDHSIPLSLSLTISKSKSKSNPDPDPNSDPYSSKRERSVSNSFTDSGYTTTITPGSPQSFDIIPLARPLSISYGNPTDNDLKLKASYYSRLQNILDDALLRMYFREFMKSNFCEENLCFWVDYNRVEKKWISAADSIVVRRQVWANDCFQMYMTYLSPCAPSEVNIDHMLRQDIIRYATAYFINQAGMAGTHAPFSTALHPISFLTNTNNTNNSESSQGAATHLFNDSDHLTKGLPEECLQELIEMLRCVNEHVCRTMAQDTVPKFVQTQKYQEISQRNKSQDIKD
ncbi:regulator of G protein signaling domain-containing protein [Phycomyces blakesleeanus]|uniref:Regulator of G protein signaling domain-containing protein n=1 Tax=Phycomyces blakesleeanus TaxID=4837 RepID=A0ABR3AT40_PHYBL